MGSGFWGHAADGRGTLVGEMLLSLAEKALQDPGVLNRVPGDAWNTFSIRAGTSVNFFKASFFSLLFVGNLDWVGGPTIVGGQTWWAKRDFWGAWASWLEGPIRDFNKLVGTTGSVSESFNEETLEFARYLGPQVVNKSEEYGLYWSRDQHTILASEFDLPPYDPSAAGDLIGGLLAEFGEAYRRIINIWAPLP